MEILEDDGRRRNDQDAAHAEREILTGFGLADQILHDQVKAKMTGSHEGRKQKRGAALGGPVLVFGIQLVLDVARNRRCQWDAIRVLRRDLVGERNLSHFGLFVRLDREPRHVELEVEVIAWVESVIARDERGVFGALGTGVQDG